MKPIALGVSAFALGMAGLTVPFAAHAETACADMAQASLPHAEIASAKAVAIKGGQACDIRLDSHPTADSDIKIEVMIPIGSAWNGKYVQVGNGGLGGQIPTAEVKRRADEGYASAGTDDGHAGNGRTAVWALGHPAKIADYGWRSLKETTEAGKALIKAQKDTGPKRSYFNGCSAGGREAMMEAQRFPADFDGIVAGAPAIYNTLGQGGRAYMQQVLNRPGGYLGTEQLQLLQTAALKICADGESYIRDQLACHFDPAALRCRPGETSGCLTEPQIASAKAFYAGRPVNGKAIFPGYEPGAEAVSGGWQTWNTGVSQDRRTEASGYAIGSQFLKYVVYQDPAFDFLTMDTGVRFDRDSKKVARDVDATDTNLTPFERRGGKLIQFHGWNDPAVAPRGTVRYHDAVQARTKSADSFYRLYMIPGMLHCQGGAGPGMVDWLAILDRWVEAGEAPHEVTASSPSGATQLLCPYPAVARKAGDGWACSVAKKKS
jgi:feruloyl esterase